MLTQNRFCKGWRKRCSSCSKVWFIHWSFVECYQLLTFMISWTVSPMSTEESPITLKAEDVTEIHHDIKLPHGTQTPYKLGHSLYSGDYMRICRSECENGWTVHIYEYLQDTTGPRGKELSVSEGSHIWLQKLAELLIHQILEQKQNLELRGSDKLRYDLQLGLVLT